MQVSYFFFSFFFFFFFFFSSLVTVVLFCLFTIFCRFYIGLFSFPYWPFSLSFFFLPLVLLPPERTV